MTKEEFYQLTQKGTLLLDGATGSCLRKAGMPVGVCPELWILEHPEVLLELQRGYAEAGSRIIYAPTFTANRAALSRYGQEDRLEELNHRLVGLTREAVGEKAYVAGDLTTTGKVLEPGGDTSYQEMYDIYREQIKALVDAGVDLLGAETMMGVEETLVLLDAAQSVCDLPVLCSLTLEADGSAMYGGSAAEAMEALQEMGAAAAGLNCSVGPDQLEAVVASMKAAARIPVIVKPNAGMPEIDVHGEAHYSMGPEQFAAGMERLIEKGADLVGGCCGTDPEYIRLLAEVIDRRKR